MSVGAREWDASIDAWQRVIGLSHVESPTVEDRATLRRSVSEAMTHGRRAAANLHFPTQDLSDKFHYQYLDGLQKVADGLDNNDAETLRQGMHLLNEFADTLSADRTSRNSGGLEGS